MKTIKNKIMQYFKELVLGREYRALNKGAVCTRLVVNSLPSTATFKSYEDRPQQNPCGWLHVVTHRESLYGG